MVDVVTLEQVKIKSQGTARSLRPPSRSQIREGIGARSIITEKCLYFASPSVYVDFGRGGYWHRNLEAMVQASLIMYASYCGSQCLRTGTGAALGYIWHPNARHIRESELGLAAAPRRGITEAAAERDAISHRH